MYRIGIDLGGTNIAAGLVDEQFRIVAKESTPTLVGRPNEAIVDDIAALCKKVCAAAGVKESDVVSIGIASPGVVDNDTGEIVYANNLGMRHFPIIPLLRERVGIRKIYIENDANAAAWGEAIAGAAKGSRSSVMITPGHSPRTFMTRAGSIFRFAQSAASARHSSGMMSPQFSGSTRVMTQTNFAPRRSVGTPSSSERSFFRLLSSVPSPEYRAE